KIQRDASWYTINCTVQYIKQHVNSVMLGKVDHIINTHHCSCKYAMHTMGCNGRLLRRKQHLFPRAARGNASSKAGINQSGIYTSTRLNGTYCIMICVCILSVFGESIVLIGCCKDTYKE
ncbi:hypothetical protein EMCRGX_G021999, partial [Ephydatia muelleri]